MANLLWENIDIADVRKFLEEDFTAEDITRVVMILKLCKDDGGTINIKKIRSLLEDDLEKNLTDRIIIALKTFSK